MRADETSNTAARLRSAIFRLSRALRAEQAVGGLGDTQFTVVNFLANNGPSSPAELAERERVTRPSINRTLNQLEEAGYIVRLENPADGRRVRIEVTERGREAATATKEVRNAWLAEKLGKLNDSEFRTLSDAARILTAFIED